MKELREQIYDLLKKYQAEKKKAALLRFEYEHPVPITPAEMLGSMAFSKGEGGIPPSVGHISDKTYHIAMNYRKEADRLARSVATEISVQLEQLERKLYRLEYCVRQLPEEQSAVIQGLYFEGKTQKLLLEELHLSESSLKRYRDKALDALTDMYGTLQQTGVVINW